MRATSLVVAMVSFGAAFAPARSASSEPAAQPSFVPSASGASGASGPRAQVAAQGVAVLAVGSARDEAFALARAVYGSRLRPPGLDEVRARVLAGAPPPANASRELRDLAEVRAGITGEDAAGRRLLTGIAQQVGAHALLVVHVEPLERAPAPAEAATATDAGAPAEGGASVGEAETPSSAGNAPRATAVVARLFLADKGEFDAARYSPEPHLEGAAAWRSTVTSLEARFPVGSRAVAGAAAATSPAPTMRPDEKKSSPFYTSGWFWGALAGAALIGGAFYFASQDTSADPIHLQLRVPK